MSDTLNVATAILTGDATETLTLTAALERGFGTVTQLISGHAMLAPERIALIEEDRSISFGDLARSIDRTAASLQRDGLGKGDVVALVSATTIAAVTAFLGVLRAGCGPAPIAPSSTHDQMRRMIANCDAARVLVDADAAPIALTDPARMLRIDELEEWLLPSEARPASMSISPDDNFNIIYSSGTTDTPRGIVQTYAMRWHQIASYV